MKYIKIFETYRNIDSLKKVAELIVSEYCDYLFNKIHKIVDNPTFLKYTTYEFHVSDISAYKEMKNIHDLYEFVRNNPFKDMEINFKMMGDDSEGVYNIRTNILSLNTIYDEYYNDILEMAIDKELKKIELYNYLKNYFVDIIVHELTHCYDYFISKGKFFGKDKKDKIKLAKIGELTDEYINIYYNLKFEVRAHLNQTVSKINKDLYLNFKDYLEAFKNIGNYWLKHLNESNKNKVYKILYFMWKNEDEKMFEKYENDYSGVYNSLSDFIFNNNIQNKFCEIYDLSLSDWEDYVNGELGYDEEIIKNICGNDYRVLYDDRKDEFVVKKKIVNKDFNFSIKVCGSNDCEDVLKVFNIVGIHTEYKPLLKVVIDSEIIGGVSASKEGEYFSFDIAVLSEYEGGGIGKKLIDKTLEIAKKSEIEYIRCEVVNPIMIVYLESIGFEILRNKDVVYAYLKINR